MGLPEAGQLSQDLAKILRAMGISYFQSIIMTVQPTIPKKKMEPSCFGI